MLKFAINNCEFHSTSMANENSFFWHLHVVKDILMLISIFRTRKNVNEANVVFAINAMSVKSQVFLVYMLM